MSSNYACDMCSENWIGKYCSFAKSSKSSYSGIIYGSYISTFDGVSFTHSTPGVYTLQHNTGTNVTLELQGEELQFPGSKISNELEVEWTEEPFIKITFGISELVLFDSNLGLVATANIQSDIAGNNQGLFGSADVSWTNDIQCEGETGSLNENDVTGTYAGECIRTRYVPSTSDVIITNEYGSETLSSGGHALSLSTGQSFSVSGLTINQMNTTFTISFWTKSTIVSRKRSTGLFALLSIDVGTETLTFQVNSDNLEINWDAAYTTTLTVSTDTWYYITFSWQSSDGAVTIYLMTEYTSESATIANVNTGANINVEEITVAPTSTARVTVDCLRMWTTTKTDKEAEDDMHAYCGASSSDTTLVLSMSFDEGNGTTSSMKLYDTNSGFESGSASGTLSGTVTNETWVPSSIPIHAVHLPDTLTVYSRTAVPDYSDAARDCLDVINNATIADNCASMTSSVSDYFLEACIREYDRAGSDDAMKILQYSLIYYCVSVAGASSECTFEDYFYFCDEEETADSKFAFWIIILLVAAVVLIALIIIVCCCKKKMAAKKKSSEEEELFSEVPHRKFNRTKLHTRETSFMSTASTRIGSPTWSDDGRSSAASMRSHGSINSRFFESPIMFIGSPPTSTQDSGRSPTPSSSRGWSPLSFSRRGSISPEPLNITVNPAQSGESSKQELKFPKGKKETYVPPPSGNQLVTPVAKMLQKARESGAGASSPHPLNPPNKAPAPQPSTARALATPASTPMPSANSSAPTSIFGSRETPLPKFSAPTSIFGKGDTPQPKFSAGTSSTRINDTGRPSPFTKGIAIPRLPATSTSLGARGKRPSNTQSNAGSIMDDIDTK